MQPGAGAGKKARNWKDVQLIISSISLALTLGLWGLWSSREKHVSGVQDEAVVPSRPQAAVPEPMLLPGQTLYLMTPAPETTATVSNQEQPRRRNKDKGGGGGGNADAGTGSS
jgi:hypothetical protein